MKLPKKTNRYCKHCKKATEHKLTLAKEKGRSATHPLSRGSTKRIRSRGGRRGYGNLGRYSKPAVAKFKRTGAKISKKVVFKYTCSVCKKTILSHAGIRAKKVVFE